MNNWRDVLLTIYNIEIGSIWCAPNSIWKNSFAKNKSGTGLHPSMVINISDCKTSCRIVPGTSKKNNGKCVSKIKLSVNNPHHQTTFFLLFF